MSSQPDSELAAVNRAIIGEALTSNAAYELDLELCDDVGLRFGGSEGEHRAAELLRGKLESFGLADVHLEELHYTGWKRGPAALEILEPAVPKPRIAALGLPYTPTADLTAELVFVGQGEVEDFERLKGQLVGKVVLCLAEGTSTPGKKSSHRREKYLRTVEEKAAGFLYVSQNPGQQLVTGSLTAGHPAEIPGVAVSLEDGADLQRLLKKGVVRVRLNVGGSFEPVVSYNVVGDVLGLDRRRHVLVGGHYDSHDVAPGAEDNGTGCAVAAEVGRLLARHREALGASVRVVLFCGEEIGLLGSWEYVRKHEAELDDLLVMLNLDSVGRIRPGSELLGLMGAADLEGYFTEMGEKLDYPMAVESRGTAYSDHFPFVVYRVPTVNLWSSQRDGALVGRGWGHTASDTVDKVEPLPLRFAAMVAARLCLFVSTDPEWPGKRRTKEEVDQLLEAEGLNDYLRRTGRFPFQP
jgi:aminopeptidase YwaD